MNMMWRWAERILARHVPADRLPAILGDLAEDVEEHRACHGQVRALIFLARETRSLTVAYRSARGDARARIAPLDELRHAWRAVRVKPGAPLAGAALLSLAIGLPTAMFSVVDSLMLRPAPFPGSERMVEQAHWRSEPDVVEAWKASGLFEAVEATSAVQARFEDAPDRTIPGAAVTPGVFGMLGVQAQLGRIFSVDGNDRVAADEVLLSDGLWRSVFGGDPSVVGRRIRVDGESLQVVGIMPATFRFPTPSTAVWRPLDLTSWQRAMRIYGRTIAEVSFADVHARLDAIAVHHAYIPRNYLGTPPVARVALSPVSDSTRQAISLLMGGVALVFLVLCANVVILLLSRLGQRQHEFATCAALGASKPRLLRQIFLEHTFIGTAGIAASLGVAWASSTMLPTHLVGRTLNVVDLDGRALTAAAIVGALAVVTAGLMPALVGMRGEPASDLRQTDTTGTTAFAHVTTQSLLLTQIALAAALLIGSTVLIRSFVNMVVVDRGLTVDGVLRVRISNADEAFPGRNATTTGIGRIKEEVAAWPEIVASAISREIPPLAYGSGGGEAHVDDVDGYRVSPEFFPLYGIRFLQGDVFRSHLDADEVIVGERLARQIWPGEDALGKTFRVPGTRPRQVVGVTREISLPALDPTVDRPEFFLPMGSTSRTLYLNLRCATSCPPAETIHERVRKIHPALGASIVPAGEMSFAQQLEVPQAIAQVSGTFAVLALVTAGCGLSCVLAFVARRRRREFGIRQMLGASPRDVRALVLKQGVTVLVLGSSLGSLLGWIGARSLSSFLYGVVALDPLTWAVPLTLLVLASLGAMWIPCRIASYVNPLMLVREE